MVRRSERTRSSVRKRRRTRRLPSANAASGASQRTRESRAAARSKAGAPPVLDERASLRASEEGSGYRAPASASAASNMKWSERRCYSSARDDDGGGFQAPRIARRCPGRTNEQTCFSSVSENGRQRLQSAIRASGASNQTLRKPLRASCERRESRADARRRGEQRRSFLCERRRRRRIRSAMREQLRVRASHWFP